MSYKRKTVLVVLHVRGEERLGRARPSPQAERSIFGDKAHGPYFSFLARWSNWGRGSECEPIARPERINGGERRLRPYFFYERAIGARMLLPALNATNAGIECRDRTLFAALEALRTVLSVSNGPNRICHYFFA